MLQPPQTQDRIFFRQLQLGPMANYVYLVGDASTREVAVVDPAWDINGLVEIAAREDLKLTHALVTHYHPDHVGGQIFGYQIEGLAELMTRSPVRVVVNRKEADGLKRITGLSDSDLVKVDGGDILRLGDVEVRLLHTPGHTPGSQCFLVNDRLVAGDTLFIGGCGRVDLPGGNAGDLYDSLHNVLMKLPEETVLFPGHAYSQQAHSTMGDEKRTNRYLRIRTKEEWLGLLGH